MIFVARRSFGTPGTGDPHLGVKAGEHFIADEDSFAVKASLALPVEGEASVDRETAGNDSETSDAKGLHPSSNRSGKSDNAKVEKHDRPVLEDAGGDTGQNE
jgi:hypothetical protein